MTPEFAAQIELFTQSELLPNLQDLKDLLDGEGEYALIVDANTDKDELVSGLLEQIHRTEVPKPPALPELNEISWSPYCLYIHAFSNEGNVEDLEGQFCLSVQFSFSFEQGLYITPVSAYSYSWNNFLDQTYAFRDDLQFQSAQDFDGGIFFEWLIESFKRFKNAADTIKPVALDREAIENAFELSDYPHLSESVSDQALLDEPNSTATAALEHLEDEIDLETFDLETFDPLTPFEYGDSEFTWSEETQTASALTSVQQHVHNLLQRISDPQFPIYCKLNPKLSEAFQVRPLRDSYGRTTDLTLEYSPHVHEAELTEQLTRLSSYQSFRRLGHLHCFTQEQMQDWLTRFGTSEGTLSADLNGRISSLGQRLSQRAATLAETHLQSSTAAALQVELVHLRKLQQQQQQQLEQLEKNSWLGYLDVTHATLLDKVHTIQPSELFLDRAQPPDIKAQYFRRKDESLLFFKVETFRAAKYQAYSRRHSDIPEHTRFVEYVLTQKLYPNRSVFIGSAPRAVHPRMEVLWGHEHEPSMSYNPFSQIWCVYPILKTDAPQWLIIAATTGNQRLKTVALENGQIAQEGTSEYLTQSLQLMVQNTDDYTSTLGRLVSEAYEVGQVKYLHLYRTQAQDTFQVRDILQFQFQLQ